MRKKEPTYTLNLTESQVDVLIQACEMLARMGMGQYSSAIEPMLYSGKDSKKIAEVREILTAAERLCRESLGTPGIREAYSSSPKIAWDLYQVLRHRLSWDKAGNPKKRDWNKMLGVHFDEPFQVCQEVQLAKIKKDGPSD